LTVALLIWCAVSLPASVLLGRVLGKLDGGRSLGDAGGRVGAWHGDHLTRT
jgi:hypothetical protein